MFSLRLPENVGSELTSLFLAKEASFPRISCPVSCWKKSVRRTVMASTIKLLLAGLEKSTSPTPGASENFCLASE